MRLLDLFSGAGGSARGYQMAGFHVTGIDNRPQPRYAGDVFIQADALEYVAEHGHEFDAIHASPPCQAYTLMQRVNTRSEIDHPQLVVPVRAALINTGKPYVIENVVGSPLENAMVLCGSMFGLKVRRHRLFEMSFFMLRPFCLHIPNAIAVYGDHPEDAYIHRRDLARPGSTKRAATIDIARDAMGIEWMVWKEITQAIPPAYTEYIGDHLLATLEPAARSGGER